jgi:ATP phosphoribosyltransferase
MRVATKYVNLARTFFATHNVIDYRIVESAGATEAAPAAGTADFIVDITTTGATLAANALKVVEDGTILRSQANLIASRRADWSAAARATARAILDRIAAERRAHAFCEVRAHVPFGDNALIAEVKDRFSAVTPFDGPTGDVLTLHCPPDNVHALAWLLRERGADAVTVATLDYVFTRDNPLYARLEAGLGTIS